MNRHRDQDLRLAAQIAQGSLRHLVDLLCQDDAEARDWISAETLEDLDYDLTALIQYLADGRKV